MSLLDLRKRLIRENPEVAKIIDKTKKSSKTQVSTTKKNNLSSLCDTVLNVFDKYRDDFICIQTLEELHRYIDASIKTGYLSIDTETTGLDPITDEIVGLCLYTVGEKPCYIPINHISRISHVRLGNQLTNAEVADELKRIIDKDVKTIFFNAKFDIRVIRHSLKLDLPCYWDTSIAAKVLKFNEEEQNLKYLWKKYCSPDKETAHYKFGDLFKGYRFNLVPINVAYLYAANDSKMTWELYEYQKPYLTVDDPVCIEHECQKLAYVFHNIENPIVSLVADIEDTGVNLDKAYCQELSKKYHKLLDEKLSAFYQGLDNYKDKIIQWRSTHPNTKISDPLNINSPVQLAELLYDVLGLQPVSKKAKDQRSTGEAVLLKLNHPLSKLILDFRGVNKLLTTYIDKMPEVANKKTGRIHCSFNQIGCDTSRFSCNDPNMQNIPSHNKDIRKMFTATKGYVLIGADFSKQEPVLTADLSNDAQFIELLRSGKDPYASIAAIAFNKPYEECLEFRPDGSTNPAGAERRSQAKAIFLGITYSKSIPAIAEDLKVDIDTANRIYSDVLKNMPCLKNFMDESQKMAHDKGYVETRWGTRKYIPDMQLEPYEITEIGTKNFDPFFDSEELGVVSDSERLKQSYLDQLLSVKFNKQKQEIKDKALRDGFKIKDNTYYIEEASRQCVNGRIQGSAANQTKIAMQLIKNNKRLKELGFRILILVHDEIIGECPVENVQEVTELFTGCMLESGKDLKAPVKVDAAVSFRWYGETLDLNLSKEEILDWYNKVGGMN